MTLVTQAILKTQTDLIDILIITISSIITGSRMHTFPEYLQTPLSDFQI